MVYGPSGLGKTLDTLYSFPNALFIAEPGALKPAKAFLGFSVPHATVHRISDITATLAELKQKDPKGERFPIVVVDDFTLLSNTTFALIEKKHAGSKDKFALFKDIRAETLMMRHEARYCSRTVIFNAHDSMPHKNSTDGRFVRGGPQLPGKLPEELPAAFDLILRADMDMDRPIGHKGIYRCGDDPNYLTKDRDGIAGVVTPMNLGEILRAAGYIVPRYKGLEWMDDVVAKVAGMLSSVEDLTAREQVSPVFASVRASLSAKRGASVEQQNWVLRDAYDREVIRRMRAMKAAGPQSIWGA